jgi:hypothetical protein
MKNGSKTLINRFVRSTMILAIGCLPWSLNASEPETSDPAITYMISPAYPANLSMIGITDGSATILISLDSEGKLVDWIPLSSTKPEFVRAVGQVIDKWEFRAAKRNGTAVPFALSISLKFRSDGAMISLNNVQILQQFIRDGKGAEAEVPLIAKYSELDRLPEPVTVVQPVLDSSIPADVRAGSVTLGFVIDAEGNVRMPALIECNGDIRLAFAAYNALAKWKFSAPLRHGDPVMTRASQKFIFRNTASNGK